MNLWQNKTFITIIAAVCAVSGVVILFSVLYPILSYETKTASSSVSQPDYTKASNWFVGGKESNDFVSLKISFYTLSIPKLKIENATVAIGGEDLSQSLIQYPGTALPGKRGNAVIFGHSILPQFYNPKDYLAIFSTLPSLKRGDEIEVEYDGISYQYRVEDIFEALTTNIQVLEQNQSDSFLTLITCVPPGHPLKPKRLVIRARIVPLEEAHVHTRH